MKLDLVSVRELLERGEKQLSRGGVPNARRNAEWIMCHVLGCTPLYLYVNAHDVPSRDRTHAFWDRVVRRADREPLQHILETTEFMSIGFEVRPGVFIPRPETESLVEAALRYLKVRPLFEPLRVLDLCCGSGIVGISIAHAISNVKVFSIDINPEAVRLTRRNARSAGVSDRVQAGCTDASSFLVLDHNEWPRHFTAIVCNPPYIATRELADLPPEVRDWDPANALDGGLDGLDFYRSVMPYIGPRLAEGGVVLFEIGATQGEAVRGLLQSAGAESVDVTADYAGCDRVAAGVYPVERIESG